LPFVEFLSDALDGILEQRTSGLTISDGGRPCRRRLMGGGASRLPRAPSSGLASLYGGLRWADHEFQLPAVAAASSRPAPAAAMPGETSGEHQGACALPWVVVARTVVVRRGLATGVDGSPPSDTVTVVLRQLELMSARHLERRASWLHSAREEKGRAVPATAALLRRSRPWRPWLRRPRLQALGRRGDERERGSEWGRSVPLWTDARAQGRWPTQLRGGVVLGSHGGHV
jgi:hypothetical protein